MGFKTRPGRHWSGMVLLSFTLGSVLGCEGSGARTGEVDDALAEIACAQLLGCDVGWLKPIVLQLDGDLETCKRWVKASPDSLMTPQAHHLIEDGLLVADLELARDCVASLQQTCDLEAAACGQWLRGSLPLGASCQTHYACASAHCDWRSGCPGVCTELQPEGVICDTVLDCSSGLDCVGGTCQSPQPGGDGNSCGVAKPQCESGLFCDGEFCRRWRGAGEACEQDGWCEPQAVCSPEGTCVVAVIVRTEGEACDPQRGRLCSLEAGLGCGLLDGEYDVCVQVRQAGEACAEPDDTGEHVLRYPCDARQPLFCGDGPEGTSVCLARRSAGEPCEMEIECESLACSGGLCQEAWTWPAGCSGD